MTESREGVLPHQLLRELMEKGYISGIDQKFLNPASIDMPLTDEAYRLPCTFQLCRGEHVRTALQLVGAEPHDLAEPLEIGVNYLIRIAGPGNLPQGVYGHGNPKSSAGRVNLFARTMADNVEMYDTMHRGWGKGELWLLVRPDSFSIYLKPGIAVSQMRLFDGASFLDDLRMQIVADSEGLIFEGARPTQTFYREMRHRKGSVMLTLAVGENFGWEACVTEQPLDFSKEKSFDKNNNPFFKRIEPIHGGFRLRKGGFYILSTRERVRVPPHLSAELRAIDPRLGEFRSHAAGYIDPGWGWGMHGEGKGRPITLEVIPNEDMLARDGQSIARLRFEHMKEVPEVTYDEANSHYTTQSGPALSKHFY